MNDNYKFVSCLLLFISIMATLAICSFTYRPQDIIRFTHSIFTRGKGEINRDRQDAMRLDISQPAHGRNLLIAHIGPYKTGTTSMQDMLAILDASGVLPRDNFYYLGKVNIEMKDIFPFETDLVRPLLWNGYKAWFQPTRKKYDAIIGSFKQNFDRLHVTQNHNVIMSAEELCTAINMNNTSLFTALEQMIPTDQYDIHFVMMYRRHFQRLLSFYHYKNYPKWFELDRWEEWPCKKHLVNSEKCGKAKLAQSFRDFYHEWINPKPSRWEPHPNQTTSLSIYENFQRLSPKNWSMNVVNIHHPDSSSSVVIDLLCGMGNITANTCKYLRSINSTDALRNYSNVNVDHLKGKEDEYTIEYMLMAQHARFKRSIHNNITRRQTQLAFQEKFREWKGGRHTQVYKEGDNVVSSWNGDRDMTIPLACLSRKEQNDILSESENIELNLLPEFYNSIYGKDSLRRQFRGVEVDHVFCNIALDTLFQNDTYWVDFLECLLKSALVQECL